MYSLPYLCPFKANRNKAKVDIPCTYNNLFGSHINKPRLEHTHKDLSFYQLRSGPFYIVYTLLH